MTMKVNFDFKITRVMFQVGNRLTWIEENITCHTHNFTGPSWRRIM